MFPLKDTHPSYSKPVMTITLIVVNLLVFLYELKLDDFSRNYLIELYGLEPAHLHLRALVTSMFLHGGIMHVAGNMWFLWIFGDNVEDSLGHFKFLVFYLLCGIAAGLAHVLMNPFSSLPTVGASGAIAGVMGGYIVKFPRARILTLVFILFFITTVDVPAVVMLAYWFIIQLFSGLGSVAHTHLSEGGGVAWFAHVGGFVAGVILIKVMGARERFSRRRDLYW
jgi:membrane associated rhomboid family serine protease